MFSVRHHSAVINSRFSLTQPAFRPRACRELLANSNFGETTFVLPKTIPRNVSGAHLTPRTELDFAGHSSVGTACALVMKQHVRPSDPVRLIWRRMSVPTAGVTGEGLSRNGGAQLGTYLTSSGFGGDRATQEQHRPRTSRTELLRRRFTFISFLITRVNSVMRSQSRLGAARCPSRFFAAVSGVCQSDCLARPAAPYHTLAQTRPALEWGERFNSGLWGALALTRPVIA